MCPIISKRESKVAIYRHQAHINIINKTIHYNKKIKSNIRVCVFILSNEFNQLNFLTRNYSITQYNLISRILFLKKLKLLK